MHTYCTISRKCASGRELQNPICLAYCYKNLHAWKTLHHLSLPPSRPGAAGAGSTATWRYLTVWYSQSQSMAESEILGSKSSATVLCPRCDSSSCTEGLRPWQLEKDRSMLRVSHQKRTKFMDVRCHVPIHCS